AVQLPGETFETLVGPWIEILPEDKYRVSPLIQSAGQSVLPAAEVQAVHETIALTIVKMKSLSPSDFAAGLLHALMAKSEQALNPLATGTIRAASPDIWRTLANTTFWFPSMALSTGQHLFEKNPAIEALLRVTQFKIAAAIDKASEANQIVLRAIESL